MKIIVLFALFLINNNMVLVDFDEDSTLANWAVVNDGVMGGESQGKFYIDTEGNGIFEGTISLENNGGFASIQLNKKIKL